MDLIKFILFIALIFSNGSRAVDTDCLGDKSVITESFLSTPVSDEVKNLITAGERAFSVDLIKSLFESFNATSKDEQNIFVSPSSIFQTLMLSYFGARGQTEEELSSVMGLDDVNRTDIIKDYLFERAFQAIRERNPDLGYKLVHANKFYFDRQLPLSPCLSMVLQDELEALDFKKSEKTRKIINQWVEEKTQKKIRELLPSGSIDESSKVALVNAAYFKGDWSSKFEVNDTKIDNFYVRRDQISMVKFMKQKGKFNYYTSEALRAHVLEMPYIGEDVSMVVILPPFEDRSLHETVSRLTPETLQGVMAEVKSGFYQIEDLNVQIPKFNIEQTFELSETLSKLGLKTLFDPATSNLSGFLEQDQDKKKGFKVNLQSAVHKSFIEVNEEGSEAAAATALFGFRSARPLFHKDFIANHPFMFLIYDKKADVILFFGVYQNPEI